MEHGTQNALCSLFHTSFHMNLPNKIPEPGFYYHYKHDPQGPIENYAYEFLSVGLQTETEEYLVNYRPLYESARPYQISLKLDSLCVDTRPLEMWLEIVIKDGQPQPRFQKITDPIIISQLITIRDRIYKSF
jgi:hypothetical protein